jgi:hypothetical protein
MKFARNRTVKIIELDQMILNELTINCKKSDADFGHGPIAVWSGTTLPARIFDAITSAQIVPTQCHSINSEPQAMFVYEASFSLMFFSKLKIYRFVSSEQKVCSIFYQIYSCIHIINLVISVINLVISDDTSLLSSYAAVTVMKIKSSIPGKETGSASSPAW